MAAQWPLYVCVGIWLLLAAGSFLTMCYLCVAGDLEFDEPPVLLTLGLVGVVTIGALVPAADNFPLQGASTWTWRISGILFVLASIVAGVRSRTAYGEQWQT